MSTPTATIKRAPTTNIKVKRDVGTYTALGYRSARVASYEGRSATGGSGQLHQQYHRLELINQSRQFKRDNGIYAGMIERAVGYIVGNGFTLDVKADSKPFCRKLEKYWRNYWRRPEIRGLLSGSRVERMLCRELLLCGDTAALKIKGGALQLIEAEQITQGRTRTQVDGIDKDAYGRPVGFYVSPYGRGGQVSTSNAKCYHPDDVLFLCDPERPSATRGVPPCQASFPMLHRINDVCDSEALSWQMLARMAIKILRDNGPELGADESAEDDPATGADGELTGRVSELDYALIFHGNVGDEISGIERNIPGKNFSESIIMFLRLLGLPLGLPLEVILLDWTKSNYSQSRAVLEQAYQTFMGWQQLIEDFFLRPVLDWKINQWREAGVLTGKVGEPVEIEFIKPTFPWLDQLKEAQAYGAKLDRSFGTHAQVCKSLGQDRDTILAARENEIRAAIDTAQKISKDTGVDVPWQIFAGLEVPGKAGAPKPADDSQAAEADKPNDNEGDG